MNYLSKGYKKNLEKKVKRYNTLITFLLLTLLSYNTSAVEINLVNRNSLINLHDGMQAFGFRTQYQWNADSLSFLTPFYNRKNIIPETNNGFIDYMMYPYWHGRLYNNYNFNNIQRIGYFCYLVNPHNGEPNLTYSWTTPNITEKANKNQNKTFVDLVLYCKGKDYTSDFLSSKKNRQTCIDNIYEMVAKRDSIGLINGHTLFNADGINIFFPDFNIKQKREFGLLIKKMFWKFRKNNEQKNITITFPEKDSTYYDYLLGLAKYVDEVHFVDYDYRGVADNISVKNKFIDSYKSDSKKMNLIEEISAELLLAEFVNPLKEKPGSATENKWEWYFLGICTIIFLIILSLILARFWCKFNQLIADQFTLYVILIILLILEIFFLGLFMIEEFNYDTWLINTNNQESNYFLLIPIVILFLVPLINMTKSKRSLP